MPLCLQPTVICQFVDSIASNPTVRLDLNSYTVTGGGTARNGIAVVGEPSMTPPPVRRVTISSMMADGELIPAWAFGNRTIHLPVLIAQDTFAAAGDIIQDLVMELVRDTNFLKVDMGNGAVFFRTFAAPDVAWQLRWRMPKDGIITLDVPCEPFGYGLEQSLGAITVNNDPAAGSNGCFFDATGIKGDVETPLNLTVGNTVVANGRRRSGIAVRRRGTPSSAPRFVQAEAMTQGTDTSTQANSATFSGAGNNYSRTTFSTATAMSQRLSTTFPAAASVDNRGVYRVFARVRNNSATQVVASRLRWGTSVSTVTNDTVSWGASGTMAVVPMYLDHGLVQIPQGYDPVTRGVSGVQIATEGIFLALDIQRVSGTASTVDIDFLMFLPADDRLCFTKWPDGVTVTDFIYEGGPRPAAYARNASAQITMTAPVEISGGGIMVTPGVTNRVFFYRDVGTGTATTGNSGDAITGTTSITPFYFPRYLFPLRSATS